MNRTFPRYTIAAALVLIVVVGLFAAGAASANPAVAPLLVVPDPAAMLLLGAGLAGLAFQGRPEYHRR